MQEDLLVASSILGGCFSVAILHARGAGFAVGSEFVGERRVRERERGGG